MRHKIKDSTGFRDSIPKVGHTELYGPIGDMAHKRLTTSQSSGHKI